MCEPFFIHRYVIDNRYWTFFCLQNVTDVSLMWSHYKAAYFRSGIWLERASWFAILVIIDLLCQSLTNVTAPEDLNSHQCLMIQTMCVDPWLNVDHSFCKKAPQQISTLIFCTIWAYKSCILHCSRYLWSLSFNRKYLFSTTSQM